MVRLATYSQPGLNEVLCFTSVSTGAQDEWVIKDFVDDAFTLGPAKSYFEQEKFLHVAGDHVKLGKERASLFIISEVVDDNSFRISPRDAAGWFITPMSSYSSKEGGIALSMTRCNKNLFVI